MIEASVMEGRMMKINPLGVLIFLGRKYGLTLPSKLKKKQQKTNKQNQ